MQSVARFMQIAVLIFGFGISAVMSANAADEPAAAASHPPILFDTQQPPGLLGETNPFRMIVLMTSGTVPILNHAGLPHEAGDIVQIIVDGGNGIQDPPQSDGTPGGDDSLAYGNFNMTRVLPAENSPDGSGRAGMFYPERFFIPHSHPTQAYYLRVWEGKDVATAPYYQNTVEYDAGDDRGGAMMFLRESQPQEVGWTFGPSLPRTNAEADKAKP